MATSEQTLVVPAADKMTTWQQIRSFDGAFWAANGMELVERWAYYGVRTVLSLYIVDAVAHGGLEFTHLQKGSIYAWWALVQSLLPMFTGGYADRYGYKKTIAVSVAINVCAYLLMATQHTYLGFFMACMLLATGTAIFKPGCQGIIANSALSRTAAVGWGIFYSMVNVGGFVGPWVAGYLRMMSWKHVFIASACLASLNLLMLLTFKEPKPPARDPAEAQHPPAPLPPLARRLRGPGLLAGIGLTGLVVGQLLLPGLLGAGAGLTVLAALWGLFRAFEARMPAPVREFVQILEFSVRNVLEPRLATFLVIFSGFWLMFMQLFDLLPNFIDDWVDSSQVFVAVGSVLAPLFGAINAVGQALVHHPLITADLAAAGRAGAQVPPEWMVNLDAGAIVFLMVPIAALFSRLKPIHSIIAGIGVAITGIVLSGLTTSGGWCLLGIFVFAVGEMMASPKKMEYLQNLAPPDKRGLYMGYANVPLAIGWGIGSKIGGYMYENFADKVNLAKHYMAHQLRMTPEAIAAIPKEKTMDALAAALHQSPREVTNMLFALHHPERIWLVFGAVGLASMIGMLVYDRVISRMDRKTA